MWASAMGYLPALFFGGPSPRPLPLLLLPLESMLPIVFMLVVSVACGRLWA